MAPYKAKSLLECMQSLSQSKAELTLNVFTYTLVISTHSCSGMYDAAPTAQHILDMMEDAYNLPSPNTSTYKAAIDAWVHSHHPEAPNKAMALLHCMHSNTHWIATPTTTP
eukprot:13939671-Ditylum_brightwellii.AAC.2